MALDVREFVKTITYKPGWKIEVKYDLTRCNWCFDFATPPFPDSTGIVGPSPISIRRFLDDTTIRSMKDPEEYLVQWIWQQLMELEQHEMIEWYKIGGSFFRDPHPEKTLTGGS